jgi:hypothetical protein
MRWAVAVALLLLLAGCTAPPAAKPTGPDGDDAILATATRVEPTLTTMDRDGPLAWEPCRTTSVPCQLDPKDLGQVQWVTDVLDRAALFWRVNATLAWSQNPLDSIRLELRAVPDDQADRTCNELDHGCDLGRVLTSEPALGATRIAGEYILHADEHRLVLIATADPSSFTQQARQAVLSGFVAPFHPVGVNVTAAAAA